MDAKSAYNQWLNDPSVDMETKAELYAIAQCPEEIHDRFSQQLEFGTGGLRGVMGVGTNRMNVYTVKLATQALAEYLTAGGVNNAGVVLAFDSRHRSREFVEAAAAVLVGNQIPVFVFRRVTPTPLLSFAVRHFRAAGGIMITASHNPKEYNGYKAYDKDGIQLHPEDTAEISRLMAAMTFADVRQVTHPQDSLLWHWIDDDVCEEYLAKLAALVRTGRDYDTGLRIVYTPLHGAGAGFVPKALMRAGYGNLYLVEEQMELNGEFPTVTVPNPEEPDAFRLAFDYGMRHKADLILATDPDCDRVGAAVWVGGRYVMLTGNQIGVLLADYLLQNLPEGEAEKCVIVKTIVTTNLICPIASKYGAEVVDTLTGFKYIGRAVKELETRGKRFLLGVEESCGYLAGNFVMDKDGVMGSVLIASAAAYYREQGLNLIDRLDQLMEEHGYYLECLHSYHFANQSEVEQARLFIDHLRQAGVDAIAGLPVKSIKDYLKGVHLDMEDNKSYDLDFPRENVLQWETTEGDVITLRPSGTEPKMKLYISVVACGPDQAGRKLESLEQACDAMINHGLTVMS